MHTTTLTCEAILAVLAVFYGLRVYRYLHRHRLWRTGDAVEGTVTSVERTGMKDSQRAKMDIRVSYVAKDGKARDVKYRAYYYAESIPKAGDQMIVRVNEANAEDAAVDGREAKSVYGQ